MFLLGGLSTPVRGELVYFASVESRQCGFIAKDGESYYAYTSQYALMSLGAFAVQTLSGVTVQTDEPLELSFDSDIARVKIQGGAQSERALEIGSVSDIGDEIVVHSVLRSKNVDTKNPCKVSGMGVYYLGLGIDTKDDVAGAPVLDSEGKVVGVASKGYDDFDIASHWNEGKVKLVRSPNKVASRLDAPIKWVSPEDAGFVRAASEIASSAVLMQEFLPLLNFWCANPYRKIPDDVTIPRELGAWARDHNNKTKAYHTLIPRIKSDPVGRRALLISLMKATNDRSVRLVKFPKSRMRQMQIQWQTPFLRFRGNKYLDNWKRVDELMEARIVDMAYRGPHTFTP